ncbi:MAG: type II secretion system protein [Succinivibrionaceae bacterium]|nr:type II secretion system protein [Succinivibrionaceae bacterium]
MNRINDRQQGFTLIELIVVIVILGILAVTAAPKFMNLTSDANASVVKSLSGAVRTAAMQVYAKSRLNLNGSADDYHICAGDECVGQKSYYSSGDSKGRARGWILVTADGYPISETVNGRCGNGIRLDGGDGDCMKISIAGAVDLGAPWDEIPSMTKDDASNKSDWILHSTADGGIMFIPKSAPAEARKLDIYDSARTQDISKGCGVYYKTGNGANETISAHLQQASGYSQTPIIRTFLKGC